MDETSIEIIKAVICFVIVILFAVLTYIISVGREEKKIHTLEQIAEELRFSFIGDFELADRELYQFDIFRKSGRKAANLLSGVRRWIKYRVFDYTYLIGEDVSTTQTVIVAELDRTDLPGFILKPGDFVYYFGKKSSWRVIEFENFPEFSGNYSRNPGHFINNRKKHAKKTIFSTVLTFVRRHGGILGCGRHPLHEEKIYKLFTPRLLKYFQEKTIGFTIEGEGNTLIFYRPGRKVRVRMMNDFIKKAMEIAQLFNRERF